MRLWSSPVGLAIVCLAIVLQALPAAGQDFTLTALPFNPPALTPGGTSLSNITVVGNTGFTGPVTLACVVTPPVQIPPEDLPVCEISPSSLSASGGAVATITTSGNTSQIGYSITITGTDASGSVSSDPLALTVLSEVAQFTVTVQSTIAPSSIAAGNGAEGVVSVNPSAGYSTPTSGYITLYCSSMTPLVTIAPVCSFSYPAGQKGLIINGNTPVTSTVTISTFGPVTTGSTASPRNFYALWLSLPMLGFVGIGASLGGKKARRFLGLLALFIVTASLLLLPACSNTSSTTSTTTPNGVTPPNTYTFTIVGVDTNGVVSSNTGSTTSAGPTVSVTVTAPATH